MGDKSSSCTDTIDFPNFLSLSVHPYHQPHLAGLPNYILCPHRADVNKFLLVG